MVLLAYFYGLGLGVQKKFLFFLTYIFLAIQANVIFINVNYLTHHVSRMGL